MTGDTPIRRQYLEIKAQHKDAILLFRLGDFYEAFDDDARILARELDIVLTSKPMGKNLRVPLAGIPYMALDRHLATLISRGHRVAICEQTSTSSIKAQTGNKLIKREVVRTVTAGTIIEPQLLDSKSNNYLASFFSDGIRAGIAYADITTGEFAATEIENRDALKELQRLSPSEIIIAESQKDFSNRELPHFVSRIDSKYFSSPNSKKVLLKHFSSTTLKPFGIENYPLAISAAGALISYLQNTQGNADQIYLLTSYDNSDFMLLDGNTMRSLEIFETSSQKSVLSIIDLTQTPMGGRLLRRWLRQPLLNVAEIHQRQDHIQWFKDRQDERSMFRELLSNIKDLERLSSRAKANYISAYELRAFGNSLEFIPKFKQILHKDNTKFGQLLAHLPECQTVVNLIKSAISEELPAHSTDQIGIIKEGFSEELDKLRNKLRDGKNFLKDLEKSERERTGIKSLRVGFNKVFGYFIEITKPNLHLVPSDYQRKQTLIPTERFVTLELKEYESLVIHAHERIEELEQSLFRQICAEIGKSRQEILLAASTLSYLDVICALAEAADNFNYCRPTVNETSLLRIMKGRHLIIEQNLREDEKTFFPNDAALGGNGAPQIALITGPNASGKSTYLRQIALIVILAQIGSFVPADEAVIGICDRIFTRIGLYDRIGSGESTFVTEMIETAEILNHATSKSLILLDELGRGTSTFDGLSVARAVLEFIHNHPKLKSRTLFATHYHELAELTELLPHLENLHFLIEEKEGNLKFLYRLEKGTSLKSYGVFAAKIAGLPKPVIRRAEELLHFYDSEANSSKSYTETNQDLSKLEKNILEIDTNSLSPVEALMKIFELQKMIEIENKPALKKVV